MILTPAHSMYIVINKFNMNSIYVCVCIHICSTMQLWTSSSSVFKVQDDITCFFKTLKSWNTNILSMQISILVFRQFSYYSYFVLFRIISYYSKCWFNTNTKISEKNTGIQPLTHNKWQWNERRNIQWIASTYVNY